MLMQFVRQVLNNITKFLVPLYTTFLLSQNAYAICSSSFEQHYQVPCSSV